MDPEPESELESDSKELIELAPTFGAFLERLVPFEEVFDKDGELFAAIGSPGGSSIIAYVAKTIIGVVDWGLPMQTAISEPNVIANGETVRIE